jgi:hypothetical protein
MKKEVDREQTTLALVSFNDEARKEGSECKNR